MEQILHYFFNLEVAREWMPALLRGFWVTIYMAAATVVVGIGLGLGLALGRAYQLRALNAALMIFVDVFRALPQLVIIILIYFALPPLGIVLDPVPATIVALGLVLAAFAEEIFWAAITAVPKGQWEAARSTGLTFTQTLVFVVVPHAWRLAIPPLTNRTIATTKATALGSVISAPELLNISNSIQSNTSSPTPLMIGTLLFLCLFFPFVRFTRWLEKRYGHWGH